MPVHPLTVLVLLEPGWSGTSGRLLGLVTAARALGSVAAVSLDGTTPDGLAELGEHGVDLVLDVAAPQRRSAQDRSSAWVGEAVAAAADECGADVVLLAAGPASGDRAARAAWLLDAGLVIDANAVTVSDTGHAVAWKRVLDGTWDTVSLVTTDRAVVTVQPHAVRPSPAAAPVATAVRELVIAPSALAEAVVLDGDDPAPDAGPARRAVTDSPVVVAGGRGTGGDFTAIEDLADALGAAVGCSGAVVDTVGRQALVGQSAAPVSPRVYVGAGISGAPEHVRGIRGPALVVAVDEDPDCPLFDVADLAIVGDLHRVLPQAAADLRRRAGRPHPAGTDREPAWTP